MHDDACQAGLIGSSGSGRIASATPPGMRLRTRRFQSARSILGWATADHMRTELVTEAPQRARLTRAGANLTATIAHSDRGSQYTSGDYRRALALMRMTQSMNLRVRAANCYDNATMESFWASLKAEAFRSIPQGRAHARLLIHDYIDDFYNTRRLHSSLVYQSPLDFERTLNQIQN